MVAMVLCNHGCHGDDQRPCPWASIGILYGSYGMRLPGHGLRLELYLDPMKLLWENMWILFWWYLDCIWSLPNCVGILLVSHGFTFGFSGALLVLFGLPCPVVWAPNTVFLAPKTVFFGTHFGCQKGPLPGRDPVNVQNPYVFLHDPTGFFLPPTQEICATRRWTVTH